MKRYEIKFFITEEQYGRLLPLLAEHMRPDLYGSYPVSSLYYDTGDYAIIRSCLEHPRYKEKFRVRSYGVPAEDGIVFAEIKKKFKGITYKRRVDLPYSLLPAFLSGRYIPEGEEQITGEIRWFLGRLHPSPRVCICYEREPYEGVTEEHLRITFDRDIRWRTDRPGLTEGDEGTPLLAPGIIIMEVKTPSAIPLWLARFFSEEKIYSTGISKYGICYRNFILPAVGKEAAPAQTRADPGRQPRTEELFTERTIYHADKPL